MLLLTLWCDAVNTGLGEFWVMINWVNPKTLGYPWEMWDIDSERFKILHYYYQSQILILLFLGYSSSWTYAHLIHVDQNIAPLQCSPTKVRTPTFWWVDNAYGLLVAFLASNFRPCPFIHQDKQTNNQKKPCLQWSWKYKIRVSCVYSCSGFILPLD